MINYETSYQLNQSQTPLCLVPLKAPLKSRYLSDESKERRGEVNCPVLVYRLIHPDEFLESQSVWTLAAEPERRIHILQHVVHLGVVNPPSELEYFISLTVEGSSTYSALGSYSAQILMNSSRW